MYDHPLFKELIDNTKDVLYNKNIIIPETSNKAAIFIENRINPHIKYAVYNHMYFLDGKFTLYIFHSKENEDYIKSELCNLQNINYISFDRKITNHQEYTNFMLDRFIYSYVEENNHLIFQSDSMMIKKWNDIYNDYDILGAPWENPDVGGNGGVSYRSKTLVDKTIENLDFLYNNLMLKGQNEDHIMSLAAHFFGLKVNKLEDGKRFSVETIYYENPMAIHQIHHYHSEENVKKIIDNIKYD